MSRKEDEARLQGMDYAYRQIKENGLEEFENELRWRGAHNISIQISPRDLDAASDTIKLNTLDTVYLLSVAVLRDQFNFGPKKISQFSKRFDSKAGDLAKGMVTWDEYRQELSEELGFSLTMEKDGKHCLLKTWRKKKK